MPATPRRDARLRRRLPPRPTYHDAPHTEEPGAAADEHRLRRVSRERAELQAQRDSRYLAAELRRVALVTGTCVAMLTVLAILQRMTG